MRPEYIIPVIVGILSMCGAIFAAWQARAASRDSTKMEQTKVDVEAFERARRTYDDIISQLEGQVRRLKETLDIQVRENYELRMQMLKLETTIRLLRQSLQLHGIDPPDVPEPPHLTS